MQLMSARKSLNDNAMTEFMQCSATPNQSQLILGTETSSDMALTNRRGHHVSHETDNQVA